MPATEIKPSNGANFELSKDGFRLTLNATFNDWIQHTRRLLMITGADRDNLGPAILEWLAPNPEPSTSTDGTRELARRLRRELGPRLRSTNRKTDLQDILTMFLAVIYVYTHHPHIKHDKRLLSDVRQAGLALTDASSEAFSHIVNHQKFCYTRHGHIGLVPSEGKPGDEIIICEGMWNSMVVRPATDASTEGLGVMVFPDTHVVVGDAFFLPYEDLVASSPCELVPKRITLV
ncbi:hypothetical protein H2200_007346 [Cladophialophora chaetospira]|uniref:Uncharacterized protein n=1 Tax=Cladophialophora chaetospira TaxID=386627 RepID=A0AA38X7S9_9EURO|nr:hypothetical protein H2200_007346 [Cladophialophora chaetospira]